MPVLSRFVLLAACLCPAGLPGSSLLDPDLPDYEPVSGISGVLDSVGSDSLNNLMTLWAEAFQTIYPNVTIQIEGKGSSTAPPALIEGVSQLGPMSRRMKSSEIDRFEAHFGYKPYRIGVALDTLAIYVHRQNPLPGLSLRQIDAIFSGTFKRGGDPSLHWSDLGLGAPLGPRRISIYGRNSASGTYGFFKQVVLLNGDFKSSVKEQPGSSSVVQAVAGDLHGIGYSGIGYKTSGVRVLPISLGGGGFVEPTLTNCLSGDYPIARLLYLYINRNPAEEIDPLNREFVRFILSRQGQAIVVRDGYYPLPASVAREYMNALSP